MRAGGWEHGAWATSYLARLPRHYMRVVAGFGSAKGTYFLRRSRETPPPTLAAKLWPWVDAAVADYEAGRVPNPDLAGKEFLTLLQRLRYVFLQDAALLQPLFPQSRLWRLALFQDPAWPPFAEKVRAVEAVQEDPAHIAIRGVVPIVADAMSAVGNRLSVGQDRLLRATLTTPAVTADLVRQALQDQTVELTAALSAAVAERRPRVLVVVSPEDVKDGVLEADGLRQTLAPAAVTDAAAIGATGASNNATTTGAVAAPPVARDAGDETRPAACPEGCPVEPLRDSVASMEALLREWFEGLGGSPSVQALEERFGSRWRYTSALRQRFYVRRKLVRWVEARAAAAGVSLAVVAAAMDRLGPSPDRFHRELGKGRDPLANIALE
jgi:hypothetical protein